MQIIKGFILLGILAISTMIGILLSCKYKNRVEELKQIKMALQIMKTKIQYTYEPIPQIFEEIANNSKQNISSLFETAKNKMSKMTAGQAWKESLQEINMNLKEEDKTVLKEFSKLLGQTDIEGQIGQINLIQQFLDMQIQKAEIDKEKNEKLYKTLGIVSGCTIVIILI